MTLGTPATLVQSANEPVRRVRRWRIASWAPVIVLVLLCAIITAINPIFLTFGNFVRISQAAMIPLVLGLGATFIILMGSIDLSVEGVLTLEPNNSDALEGIAAINARSGDSVAALAAVEHLAAIESDPRRKGEVWVRAGQLVQQDGRDGGSSRGWQPPCWSLSITGCSRAFSMKARDVRTTLTLAAVHAA